MALGPVDVAIIAFPGNKFTGQIAPAIADLVRNGTVRILDLEFVMKDVDGTIAVLQAEDITAEHGAAFAEIDIHQPGALGQEDADEIAEELEPGSSVLLIAWENTWAARLVEAFAAADAQVLDFIRIPAEIVDAVAAG